MSSCEDACDIFDLSWDDVPGSEIVAPEETPENYLVYCDRNILSDDAINHRLFKNAIWVSRGEKYRKFEDNCYEINPTSKNDHQMLLQDIPNIKHIFYFWGLPPYDSNDEIPPTVFDVPLKLIQSLSLAQAKNGARLWFITSSAQAVAGTHVLEPFQAIIAGFARTAMEEYPELNCTLVDLESPNENGKITLSAVTDLFCEISTNKGEKEVAWRSRKRYLPRLNLSHNSLLKQQKSLSINSSGAHLIIGGYGALGQTLTKCLAQKGVRNIALVGRNPPSKEALGTISEIERMGTKILVLSGDVAIRGQVASMIEKTIEEFGSLSAIYHAAGVIDECSIDALTADDFKKALNPKVMGGLNLHEVIRSLPHCRLVLFSSVSAILGWARFSTYTAANAFLDALAHKRQAEGLPTTSLAFGPFSGRGLLADKGRQTEFPGLPSLSPSQVIGSIDWDEAVRIPYSILMKFNATEWTRIRHVAGQGGLFTNLIISKDTRDECYAEQAGLRDLVLKQPPSSRFTTLHQCVANLIATTCSIPVNDLKPDAPFTSLGITSIASIDIRNELQDAFSLRLPATLLWNCTTLSSLLSFLAQQIGLGKPDEEITAESKEEQKQTVSANIKTFSEQEILTMSDAEVAHLLSKQLDAVIK